MTAMRPFFTLLGRASVFWISALIFVDSSAIDSQHATPQTLQRLQMQPSPTAPVDDRLGCEAVMNLCSDQVTGAFQKRRLCLDVGQPQQSLAAGKVAQLQHRADHVVGILLLSRKDEERAFESRQHVAQLKRQQRSGHGAAEDDHHAGHAVEVVHVPAEHDRRDDQQNARGYADK